MRWFSLGWYQFLFSFDYKYSNVAHYTWRQKIKVFLCRLTEHKAGPVYYDFRPDVTEPDMRCNNCGEYIG